MNSLTRLSSLVSITLTLWTFGTLTGQAAVNRPPKPLNIVVGEVTASEMSRFQGIVNARRHGDITDSFEVKLLRELLKNEELEVGARSEALRYLAYLTSNGAATDEAFDLFFEIIEKGPAGLPLNAAKMLSKFQQLDEGIKGRIT